MEVANFCAAIDTLIDQDDIKVGVANFCAAIDTLIDQDALTPDLPLPPRVYFSRESEMALQMLRTEEYLMFDVAFSYSTLT